MRVSQRSLSRYRRAVDEQAELAKAYVDRSLDAYFAANSGYSTADGRRFAVELLKAAMPNFCDTAGTLAADFFDEIAEAEGMDVDSRLYDATDYSIIEDKVRFFARKLNDGDVEAFKNDVVDATHYFVKRSAYENMVRNCDANNVRYARVPTGFETCAFCFMLASRGFVYHSEATAKGLHGMHVHCDCCIIPGKKGRTKIEGYDPEGMYKRWSMCAKAIGLDPNTSYVDARKAIRREVETRDWHWLYTGEPPKYQILEGAKPSDEEKETANRLAESGYRSVFRPTRSKESKRTSDVFFDNGVHKTPWEYKNPKGNGNQTVSHQFEEAAGQSRNLVIDSRLLGDSWTDKRLIDEARQKLNRRKGFKIEKGEHKGEIWYFDQVIVILRDKSTVKMRRG